MTLSRALWILSALAFVGTLLLWWVGSLPAEPEVEVHREVFGNIPDLLVALFYVLVAAFLAASIGLFAMRAKNWERGTSENRSGEWKRRTRRFVDGVTMKTVAQDRGAAGMHALIYWSFVVLFLGTVTLEIDHLLPVDYKFLTGRVYQWYSLILDAAAVLFLVGLAWAAIRRLPRCRRRHGAVPWCCRSPMPTSQ